MMPTEDALSKAPTRNGSAVTGLDTLPNTSFDPDALSQRLQTLKPPDVLSTQRLKNPWATEDFLENNLARVLQIRTQMSRCAPLPSLGGKFPLLPQFVSLSSALPQRKLATPPPTVGGSPIMLSDPLSNMSSFRWSNPDNQ